MNYVQRSAVYSAIGANLLSKIAMMKAEGITIQLEELTGARQALQDIGDGQDCGDVWMLLTTDKRFKDYIQEYADKYLARSGGGQVIDYDKKQIEIVKEVRPDDVEQGNRN